MCGAKHAGRCAACVKKCLEGGMTPVFVDEAKKAVWTIDNPDAVKGFYWQPRDGDRERGYEQEEPAYRSDCGRKVRGWKNPCHERSGTAK